MARAAYLEGSRSLHELDRSWRCGEPTKVKQAMFFDGIWPKDLRAPLCSVAKPYYTPTRAVMTDVLPLLTKIIYGEQG